MTSEGPRPRWSYFAALSLSAFGLNWLWKIAQMLAFAELAGRSWREAALPCAKASLGDVLITLAIYAVGALAAGQFTWGMTGKWNVYATAALLGGALAVGYEWLSQATARWTYTDRMPVVPVLRVGLWPLLQLSFLTPVCFWIARRAIEDALTPWATQFLW